ncbi:hypothetical protein ACFQUU_23710 [Herbaspirillum sp. GCM10030257]|uniref:hypothetical protein n=1 Tax=Herbaspirillum sp. GCM10030257 TaxID=3273393 RepID=UPI00361FC8A4
MKKAAAKRKESLVEPQSPAPNPYAMAVLTAVLAGLFAVIGGYFTSAFQARHAIAQKQLEYRVAAYSSLLDKTNLNNAQAISQILNIGQMADHIATDGEIQAFEDRIADLLKKQGTHDLYLQLSADLNLFRLHGSGRAQRTCDDLLKALMLRDFEIDWKIYPPDVGEYHEKWKTALENGTAYGWEERVSSDERLMVITMAKLTQLLIRQLKEEIHGAAV